jgi:very-short-patch-repair endonuclease
MAASMRTAEDGRRDSELCALGYRVIRFWNNDVIDNLDGVLEALEAELEKWPLTPPSPRKRRKRGEGDGQAGGRLF